MGEVVDAPEEFSRFAREHRPDDEVDLARVTQEVGVEHEEALKGFRFKLL